jgi:hypothetical protein
MGRKLVSVRDENKLKVFENRVLRKIFGPKKEEVREEWRNYMTRNLITTIFHQAP